MLITDPSIVEIFKEASDDFFEQTGPTNGTRKARLRNLVGNYVNARSARGGLAFDGTSGARVAAPMGVPGSIGTDSCSVVQTIEIPSVNSPNSRGLWYFSSSSASSNVARSLYAEMKTSGEIVVYQLGATTVDQRVKTYLGIVSRFAGKRVIFCYVRSVLTNTFNLYANGDLLTGTETTVGTPPAWSDTITTSYFVMGNNASSSEAWSGCIYSASLYNLALSQSGITEIQELGGAVPERFKTGSQVAKLTQDFSTAGGWTGGIATTDSISTVASQIAANADGAGIPPTSNQGKWSWATGNTRNRYLYHLTLLSLGKVYQLSTSVFVPAGSAVGQINITNETTYSASTNRASAPITAGATTSVALTLAPATSTRISLNALTAGGSDQVADSQAVYFTNLTVKQLGAVAHYSGDDLNASAQWLDQLANGLHALRTFAGTAPTKFIIGQYPIRLTSDGTTTAQQLGGGTLLPANCVLREVWARAQSGTPSIILGSSSGGSQFIASVALTTTWQKLTIALTNGLVTAATPVWATASTANVVEVRIVADQLS